MRRTRVWTAIAVAACLALTGISGCASNQPATLPADPLCGIFTASETAEIAAMLPSGDYQYVGLLPNDEPATTVTYDPRFHLLYGDCNVTSGRTQASSGMVKYRSEFSLFVNDPNGWRVPAAQKGCDDAGVFGLVHGAGEIEDGVVRVGDNCGGPGYSMAIWGHYRTVSVTPMGNPVESVIVVEFSSRSGRDAQNDGIRVLQMVIDFLDRSAVADEEASVSPSATESPR